MKGFRRLVTTVTSPDKVDHRTAKPAKTAKAAEAAKPAMTAKAAEAAIKDS